MSAYCSYNEDMREKGYNLHFTAVFTMPHRCSLNLLTTPKTEIRTFFSSPFFLRVSRRIKSRLKIERSVPVLPTPALFPQ